MPGNELLCNVVQIISDDLRLWADWQNIIADSFDKRRFPPPWRQAGLRKGSMSK